MRTPPRVTRRLSGLFGTALALACAGCSSVAVRPDNYQSMLAYQPERSPTKIDAAVRLEVTHTLPPEVRTEWKQYLGDSDAVVDNYREAVARAIADDLVNSGLFSRVNQGGSRPDLLISIRSEELLKPTPKLRATEEVTDAATKEVISARTREVGLGSSLGEFQIKTALPRLMASLRADMLGDILGRIRRRQEQADQAKVAALEQAPLADLLVAGDKSAAMARERNRALIAARDQQLPDILRNQKTDQLTALVVKLEQTILDLDHESQAAKDRIQQAAAGRANSRPTDELRDLMISYRERIELLKPILATVKEEIANRNR